MYMRIRHYRLKDLEEGVRRARESFVPLIRKVPGFRGYYIVRGEEGAFTSISMFETREGAEESHRLSDEWNREHLEDLVETVGDTVVGEAVIAEMPEREEYEERRAA